MNKPNDKGAADSGKQDAGQTYLVIGAFSSQFAGLSISQGCFLKNVNAEQAKRMVEGRLLTPSPAGPSDHVIDYAEYTKQVNERLALKAKSEENTMAAKDRLKAKAKAAADQAYKAVIEGK